MAEVVKSIGTTGRDYSTISAWEAAINNTTYPTASTDVVGECYADSDFDEATTINDTDTNIVSVRLSVAASERHTGVANTGVRVLRTGAGGLTMVGSLGTLKHVGEWLEIDMNGQGGTGWRNNGTTATHVTVAHHMIVHGATGGEAYLGAIRGDSRDILVHNCIVYDHSRSSASLDVIGISIDGDMADAGVFNCTVFAVENTSTGLATGIKPVTDSANHRSKNNISMGQSAPSGTTLDFKFPGTNADSLNNMSEDTSADDAGGTGHLISKSASTQFVSTTGGSEDFHIVTGSDAKDAGLDLGGVATDIEIDIDGEDRTAVTTWDLGVHEFELPVAGGNPPPTGSLAIMGLGV